MPKVLIKNGDNKITWYHGMGGKVFPVDHIKNGHYMIPNEYVPDGNHPPCGIHISDGELLYTEAEYNDLENHYMNEIDKLKSDYINLKRDRNIIQKAHDAIYAELEREREGKKVPLPRKVAEAIETFFEDGHDADYIIRQLAFGYSDFSELSNRMKIIHRYAREYGHNLISAIVNGYTIEDEPTPKERAIKYLNDNNVIKNGYSAHDVVTKIMKIMETE